MKIYNVTNQPFFCANSNVKNQPTFTKKHLAASPVYQGLNTAGAWFSFGVGLDYVSRKVTFSKSPLKNSIALNGIIGAAAGLVTGYKVLRNKDN